MFEKMVQWILKVIQEPVVTCECVCVIGSETERGTERVMAKISIKERNRWLTGVNVCINSRVPEEGGLGVWFGPLGSPWRGWKGPLDSSDGPVWPFIYPFGLWMNLSFCELLEVVWKAVCHFDDAQRKELQVPADPRISLIRRSVTICW